MKLRWYILSVLAAIFFALPAEAARLLFWDFDRDRNSLSFTTDSSVRPTVRLIANPTRLVIDLPGTGISRSASQRVGGAIASVRVGQPDNRTTRLVVELAPGYFLDPQQVKIAGTPSQWTIQLPSPQRSRPTFEPLLRGVPEWFQITKNGFFIRLRDRDRPEEIKVDRSDNGRQINIELKGARVRSEDSSKTFTVDRYGVEEVRFNQLGNNARITLTLDRNSPRWEVSDSRGGISIVPEQGSEILRDPPSEPSSQASEIVIPVPLPTQPTVPDRTNFPQPNGRALVVLDPGHGGKDPGAIGIGGLRETDVVLPISLEIAQILRDRGINVVMTRSDDRFISLQERAYMANRTRADIFTSIHANAVGGYRPEVNGMETYYYSRGYRLAQIVHQAILETVPIARNRGIKQARFYVLRNTSMPSILVEVGFVTGQIDSRNLANPAYRSQMAQAIALGILRYLQQYP
ncbi:N-acetylmuramoyl-L-alanine amidase [Spirulina sp. 06S082]|uniref:N-acetylmuramoyl-L-alanine amidase n=1 Tax=Spirulina sp. 06S082 TaxID=3110248 RepID=UPI002B20D42B|nr:N-acetylmuramoyl-L-alanine amidase [Spirulina sp. 06S082]MEA5471323.1 N-acetylmuramoyl-L-alanine amidase [Spirulina sp. 06S082]